MKALEVKGLCKQYGDFALDNVNFSLEQGSITGLVGRNGAGKTTILLQHFGRGAYRCRRNFVFGTADRRADQTGYRRRV